jgi:prostaglandin-E synthase
LFKRIPHSSHCLFSADVKGENIVITDSALTFQGKSEDKDYQVNIEFLNAVDAEGSTYKVLPRSVQMHILKKDKEEEEFWTRLLKDKALEKNQVKIDWDRYVDEDEEEEGFDMSNLEGGQGMGGPPGMGGMGGGPPGMGGMGGMPPGMGGMGGMPGMGGMGGMPGMGGMGGGDMGGMDMEALVSFFL